MRGRFDWCETRERASFSWATSFESFEGLVPRFSSTDEVDTDRAITSAAGVEVWFQSVLLSSGGLSVLQIAGHAFSSKSLLSCKEDDDEVVSDDCAVDVDGVGLSTVLVKDESNVCGSVVICTLFLSFLFFHTDLSLGRRGCTVLGTSRGTGCYGQLRFRQTLRAS